MTRRRCCLSWRDRQHLYRIQYQQADPDTLDEEVTAA
jgi:hypothetical protein